MAGERQLPGLGLHAFWTPGTNGWGAQNDANWRIVSALLQGSALSATTSLPGSPADGDIYIIPTGDNDENKVALRDNGAWVLLTPETGWMLYIADVAEFFKFNGSTWEQAFVPTTIPTVNLVTETGTSRTLTDADFDGYTILLTTNAAATSVTLPSGISASGPLMIVQVGVGAVSIVSGGGVTLNSADNKTSLRTQYSSAVLIPVDVDECVLVGDLA
jgi:hypothetical protein